jgi:putative Ca2+/H+ antiporter (TMEM165/GDT1 family)
MEAFLLSIGVVALAEIGDKSQLVVLALATRFRRPIPIILGMLAATVLNHVLAAQSGVWLAALISPHSKRWILGLSLFAMAIWSLRPEATEATRAPNSRFGVFGTTLISCFLMEMGDKTQFATIALAAHFNAVWVVVAGSAIGTMLVDAPTAIFGSIAGQRLPRAMVARIAPVMFLALGVVVCSWDGAR